ncbi:MAG: DUF86 domain-containing protein [Bacteroidetes bacterium]|nr:MAG: DUF86 domain-containing protein [Bacteroidota bacterium]
MKEETEKYLTDIDMCIARIEKHISNCKSYPDFEENITVVKAIEREFEIIGEALRKMRDIEPNIAISSYKKIIGLRNLIAHAYDLVEASQLWGIIINHLPKLKSEVDQLLKK